MAAKNELVAICADENSPESLVSSRFARCNYYTVYNHETLEFTYDENQAKEEMSGAGGKAAKQIADLGVSVVLVPEVGPKAYTALEAFGIKIYQYSKKTQTVRDALYEYYEDKLPKLTASSKEGKHS